MGLDITSLTIGKKIGEGSAPSVVIPDGTNKKGFIVSDVVAGNWLIKGKINQYVTNNYSQSNSNPHVYTVGNYNVLFRTTYSTGHLIAEIFSDYNYINYIGTSTDLGTLTSLSLDGISDIMYGLGCGTNKLCLIFGNKTYRILTINESTHSSTISEIKNLNNTSILPASNLQSANGVQRFGNDQYIALGYDSMDGDRLKGYIFDASDSDNVRVVSFYNPRDYRLYNGRNMSLIKLSETEFALACKDNSDRKGKIMVFEVSNNTSISKTYEQELNMDGSDMYNANFSCSISRLYNDDNGKPLIGVTFTRGNDSSNPINYLELDILSYDNTSNTRFSLVSASGILNSTWGIKSLSSIVTLGRDNYVVGITTSFGNDYRYTSNAGYGYLIFYLEIKKTTHAVTFNKYNFHINDFSYSRYWYKNLNKSNLGIINIAGNIDSNYGYFTNVFVEGFARYRPSSGTANFSSGGGYALEATTDTKHEINYRSF